MITLTSAAQAALTERVTCPIYLVEIDFDPTSRLSTHGDVSWNGEAWSGAQSLKVSGLTADGSGSGRATVLIGNADLAMGALVLNQGAADKAITIWGGDADALAAADPVLLFSGVIASAEVSEAAVTFQCAAAGTRTQMSPRRYIGPSAGFNSLIPAGTKIRFGTSVYTLERP